MNPDPWAIALIAIPAAIAVALLRLAERRSRRDAPPAEGEIEVEDDRGGAW